MHIVRHVRAMTLNSLTAVDSAGLHNFKVTDTVMTTTTTAGVTGTTGIAAGTTITIFA